MPLLLYPARSLKPCPSAIAALRTRRGPVKGRGTGLWTTSALNYLIYKTCRLLGDDAIETIMPLHTIHNFLIRFHSDADFPMTPLISEILRFIRLRAVLFSAGVGLFYRTPTGNIHPTKQRKHAHKFSTSGSPPPLLLPVLCACAFFFHFVLLTGLSSSLFLESGALA